VTENESWVLIGKLAVETQGWDETNIEATRRRIEKWPDPLIGDQAIEDVIASWDRPGRPLWAVLNTAYRTVARREAMSTPAIGSQTPGRIVSVTEGRAIVAQAYAKECAKRDPETDPLILAGFRSTEPNHAVLDGLLGFVGDDGDDR
jgi:hypothetical protein